MECYATFAKVMWQMGEEKGKGAADIFEAALEMLNRTYL